MTRQVDLIMMMANYAITGMRVRGYEPTYLLLNPQDLGVIEGTFSLERDATGKLRLMGVPVRTDPEVPLGDVLARWEPRPRPANLGWEI